MANANAYSRVSEWYFASVDFKWRLMLERKKTSVTVSRRWHGQEHFQNAGTRRTVGRRYAILDQLKAQIAEALARQNPHRQDGREQARHARSKAQESARAVGNTGRFPELFACVLVPLLGQSGADASGVSRHF